MKITSQFIKRFIVYIIGIYFTAIAIAISKMTPLGISPNSSLPNEISLITGISLGLASSIVYVIYVFIQWILLGKEFNPLNFIQVILAIFYGFFVNSALFIVEHILPPCNTYIMQLIYIFASAILLGAAIKVYMTPGLMSLPAESLAKSVAQRFKIPFHTAKNVCDITIVTLSIILSLVYFKELYGIREGTIIHAIMVGRTVKISDKLFGEKLHNYLFDIK